MIALTDEHRDRLASAVADGLVVIAATVDAGGKPHVGFYGSTQVLDETSLAIWVRNPVDEMFTRIKANPNIFLLYRNPADRLLWRFEGTAAIDTDPAVAQRVYDAAPDGERALDPERGGTAVVITLDRVRARVAGQESVME